MTTHAKLPTLALLLLVLTAMLAGCGDDPSAPAAGEQLADIFTEEEVVLTGDPAEWNLRLVGVIFITGSAQLRESSYAVLDKFGQVFAAYHAAEYAIEGHTDSRGSSSSNQSLSEDRAESVLEYLLERHGRPGGGLTAAGYGETRPLADNGTAQGRALNRRIEVIIRP